MKNKIIGTLTLVLLFVTGAILSACGNPQTNKIVFNPNNGDEVTAIEYTSTSQIIPPTPEIEGYSFDGWFWDKDVWNKPFTINSILDQPLQADVSLTVYAKWENRNTLLFNANGGSGAMEKQIIPIGTSVTIPENKFTKTGHTFIGWSIGGMQGNFVVYTDKAIFNMADNGGLTLYAEWQANNHTITYKNNLPTNLTETQFVTFNAQTILCGFDTFTKTGYSLKNWNTKADGSGDDYSLDFNFGPYNLTNNLVLYAVWEVDSYTVTYNSNFQDEKTEIQNIIFDENVHFYGFEIFIREGYTLKKWNTNKDGNGTNYSLELLFTPYNIAENLTLYAIWEANEYELSLDVNGGNLNDEPSVIQIKYDDYFVLPMPTREGLYRFDGWFNGEMLINSGEWKFASDRLLTAKWTYQFVLSSEGDIITGVNYITPHLDFPSEYNSVTITGISGNGFSSMYGVETITIPHSIKTLSQRIFANCESLNTINFNATRMNDLSEHSSPWLFSTEYYTSITINIGSNVEKIPNYMFYRMGSAGRSISAVNFSHSGVLEEIGGYAFYDCTGLWNPNIPASVNTIGNYAFANIAPSGSSVTVTINNNYEIIEIATNAFKNTIHGQAEISIWAFYVPEHLVELYKEEPCWASYADRIFAKV